MNTKITLSINEEYLFSISSENYQDNSIVRKLPFITAELLGMIKCDNKDFDYKRTLEDVASEKYQ